MRRSKRVPLLVVKEGRSAAEPSEIGHPGNAIEKIRARPGLHVAIQSWMEECSLVFKMHHETQDEPAKRLSIQCPKFTQLILDYFQQLFVGVCENPRV